MATGKIRRYVIWITTVGCLVFPLTWIAFELGAPSESTYVVFIIVYIVVEVTRLWLMKEQLHFPVSMFMKDVLVKIIIVIVLSAFIPIIFIHCIESSMLRTFLSFIICLVSSIISIYFWGLTRNERLQIVNLAKKKLHI